MHAIPPCAAALSVISFSGRTSGASLSAKTVAAAPRPDCCLESHDRKPSRTLGPSCGRADGYSDATEKLLGLLCEIHRQLRKRCVAPRHPGTSRTHLRFLTLPEASALFAKSWLKKVDFALEGCSAFSIFNLGACQVSPAPTAKPKPSSTPCRHANLYYIFMPEFSLHSLPFADALHDSAAPCRKPFQRPLPPRPTLRS